MRQDSFFMCEALRLAKRGGARTYPNPLVGAVVVRKGRIIGRGFHACFGAPHAEVMALGEARSITCGATLYVSLEPCSTYGKTPPCTSAIIESGIRRVVIAVLDPNAVHHGRGKELLKRSGIKVTVGVEQKAAEEQNASFFKYHKTGFPYIHLKMAESLDGKIASRAGDSKWITGKPARRFVHELRSKAQAILVGSRTVFLDDPRLNVRLSGNRRRRQPVRIVIDPDLKLPLGLRIFKTARQDTWIITKASLKSSRRWRCLERSGVRLVPVPCRSGKPILRRAMRELARCGIINILVEGGGETAASFLKERLVDKITFLIAPKIIGGRDAKTSVEGDGARKVSQALKLKNVTMRKIGDDICIEGIPAYCL
ncbi:MAG: bifunctional diaminohydroxyphosphoribosylaminopyrimidine deaminase/5-amino-6-(5-phosphoribosylamino)uracil reductase RibD [Candidatus Omnitrophica bacterium]|nr:bifunctional diaminohydroxyphosphoribosylaminopyrimidine deaminase/5-amino-6-(5-phosphoribosylamino)uracil reductase RibD [Candidatus Omnitrophota bacterium]